MIDSKKLLSDLESKKTSRTTMVKRLEDDLRKRCDAETEVDAPLKERYEAAKAKKRTALTYKAWRDDELTQIAVAWVLGCVFVRFLEDNELVETPKLSGPGDRLRRAQDEHELFFQRHPTSTEREFLLEVFEQTGRLPGMKEFFDKRHNPLWLAAPSGDACRELWLFWQKTDPETGDLLHDFTDPEWNTRFLGDLYQDLSEAARKKYALLQTPDFVEEFILDRTLTPAIETFGYREVRMIDPTCGSGHFCLGGFARIFRLWQQENPEENSRVLAQHALDAVCGVDLNPFAVAIARFRLLLAALQVCGVKRLADAPDFRISLAVGDSLIHGARFDSKGQPYVIERQTLLDGEEEVFKDEMAHFFDTEDSAELHRILGRQYHAVVGNPPYITVKDKALNQLYRQRYDSCSGKYALSVPFMERFFDLALSGSGDGREPAGFTGQITSNSFMKREFGKKLIEEHIPRWDLTHVLDTGGAYIPGHGTPTVIIFGRNAKPFATTLRAVMGIKGEPSTPDDPAKGRVWSAILDQVDRPGSESDFVSAADLERQHFHVYPWSVGGGRAGELKRAIESCPSRKLVEYSSSIGFASFPGQDEIFIAPRETLLRKRVPSSFVKKLITGEIIRDWEVYEGDFACAPYDLSFRLVGLDQSWSSYLWLYRTTLRNIVSFGGATRDDLGADWWGWYRWIQEKYENPISITFASVASQNHFIVDSGGTVFKQSAPVIKLKAGAGEDMPYFFTGLLNSSLACFWLKQVCYPKATSSGDISTVKGVPENNRYDFSCTAVGNFPIPVIDKDLEITISLAAKEIENLRSCTFSDQIREALDEIGSKGSDDRSISEIIKNYEDRTRAIHDLQENIDAQVIKAFNLPTASSQDTAKLLQEPMYQRLWKGRQGVYGSAATTVKERLDLASREWLLARLEGYFFEGSRVCDLKDTFDPAAHGFTAATRPHLVTANQLADVVSSDTKFLEAAEVYEGASGFSVPNLIRTLVGAESVPYLPIHRYKNSGLRKRHDWEATWELQRQEDEVEEGVRNRESGVSEEELKKKIRKAQQAEVGDIAVPPKFAGADFAKPTYWKLRGKLDVPKERWISYPGAERAGDDSLLIAWAGWDHLQQAQALSEYFIDAQQNQGFPPEKLRLLLAGLADLIPWLKQWHNSPDPNLGMGLGDYFAGFLEEQSRALDLTVEEVAKARFEG